MTDDGTISKTHDPDRGYATDVALKVSEVRFKTLFEHSRAGVVLADTASRYLDANPSACRMLGYTRDELTGLHASDILAASEAPDFATALKELDQNDDHRREWRFRRKDGSEFFADVVATSMPDGTLLGVIHDLTAEKQALQHEQEIARLLRLNTALHQISQSIASTHERDRLFRDVCRVLVEHGGLRMAWVGWRDPASHRLEPIAGFGDELGYLGKIAIYTDERPESQGPSGTAFRTGQPVINNNLLGDSAMLLWRSEVERSGFRSSAALPIREGGDVCAVLSVYADRKDFFRDKEVALLVEAASDLSFALDMFRKEDDRRVAEETLRDEKQFTDAMIESMPGIFYFYDKDGHFLRWNRNFETVSGYSGAQISRMHPREFFSAEERPHVEQRIARVFEDGEASVEASFIARDGTATPYFFTGRRITYNDEPCLVGVGIDIAERKRAEARLRKSQSHLNDAQRIAGIGSWSFDIRSGRRTWSDQMLTIFGIALSEFDDLDETETLLDFVHPDDREELISAREAAIAGRQRLDIEYRIVRRDGTECVVHQLADLHTNEDGEPVSLAGTMHDITDRARMQAERDKRHRAEAADRIKSAFLAIMSHEFTHTAQFNPRIYRHPVAGTGRTFKSGTGQAA
ncbi:MAG: PAS domain S-box protein [Woeseiaceae bacterium]|nr:PAS domain S-box protein [Woeseiaceae bacterium]